MNLKENYVAGFLQKEIEKKVQQESEVEHANDPIPPLPKYVKPQKVALTAGVYNFIKFNVLQLLP